MIKLLLIGLKDVRLAFRDRAALILMLLAPFALTVGLGLVTGRFSGGNSQGISDIPVVLVNEDGGQLGDALVNVFYSSEVGDLVAPRETDSVEQAKALVDGDTCAAAVIIPAGFTSSIIPTQAYIDQVRKDPGLSLEAVSVEIYTNPARQTGAGVVKTIVEEFISRVEQGRVTGMTSTLNIPGINSMPASEIEAKVKEMFANSEDAAFVDSEITLKTNVSGPAAQSFDPLAYMAPGMALMFLMYTVSYGARSILAERHQGTLPRLMVSPTHTAQILGGKVVGIFLTGCAQMGILTAASALFFQVKWGDAAGLGVLITASVFGATGWGMLVASIARTPGQVGSIGSALMLIFGILGGSFISLDQLPPSIRMISRITPNAWGLDGFTTLALGGTLVDLGKPVLALGVMGALLFSLSAFLFSRSGLVRK